MKNVCNLLKMKMLGIKIIFLFTFIFISVSFVNAQKEIKQIVIRDYRIQEVKRQNERLRQQIDSLRIGDFFEKKLNKKFNDAIQKHTEEESKFLVKFDLRQISLMTFATNLSILLGKSSFKRGELGIALFCYLYSIEEYEEGYYKSLSSILQNKLKKENRSLVLRTRLEKIYKICQLIIEKNESLPDFTLKEWKRFRKAKLYLDSDEIQNLRIKIICEMNNFLENKKEQINEGEKE